MNKFRLRFEKDLQLFHQASNIPLCVFDNSPKDIFRYPWIDNMDCSPKTLHQCIELLKERDFSLPLPILISSNSCFFALLRLDENTNVMFGPISSIPQTYKEFYNTHKNNCDPDDLLHLYQVIQQSPHITLTQFVNNISLYIKLAFHIDISTEEILNNHIIFSNNDLDVTYTDIDEPKYITVTEAIGFQKKILFHIQNGNIPEIKKLFCDTYFFLNLENAPSSIEELKKIFFIYATICCVIVIEEGVDVQIAFPILDTYIAKIPSLKVPDDLAKLCLQLSIDYCHQTIKLHNTQSNSPIVSQCLQYIQNNIYSKITIDDLAKHCNLSKRTITRHFSDYHHISASEYILQLKLKEAAFLLTNSLFSLVEISNQLAFSSQSHFSVAFKKQYSYTPQQYRDKFKKI